MWEENHIILGSPTVSWDAPNVVWVIAVTHTPQLIVLTLSRRTVRQHGRRKTRKQKAPERQYPTCRSFARWLYCRYGLSWKCYYLSLRYAEEVHVGGMIVTVDDVLSYLAAGMAQDEVLADFACLTYEELWPASSRRLDESVNGEPDDTSFAA